MVLASVSDPRIIWCGYVLSTDLLLKNQNRILVDVLFQINTNLGTLLLNYRIVFVLFQIYEKHFFS